MYNRKLLVVFLLILSCSTFVFGRSLGEGDYIFITDEELELKEAYLKMGLKGGRDFLSVFSLEPSSEDEFIYFDPFKNIFYKKTTEGFVEVASIKVYEDHAEISNEKETICISPSTEYELTLVRTSCDS